MFHSLHALGSGANAEAYRYLVLALYAGGHYDAALHAFEPHFPWRSDLLAYRAACYEQRGDPIRVLPFPGKPFHRTINVVSLKNEGQLLAEQIRGASIDALKQYFMPPLRKLMPEIARQTTLHGAVKG